MNGTLSIARFEWHYHWRRPMTYLFASLIFGQGLWYTHNRLALYQDSSTAVVVYRVLASLGVVLASVTVLLAGQSLTKDWEYRAASYLYTLPISSRAYFAGRFLGTYGTALALSIFYPLGILAFFLFQRYPADAIPWFALVDGFTWLIPENVLVVSGLAFSLTVFSRSIRGAFVVLCGVVLYFLLTGNQTDHVFTADLWLLLDPFGVDMARESVEVVVDNDGTDTLFAFSDMLLINRLLWLGLVLGLVNQAEAAFSFQTPEPPVNPKYDRVTNAPVEKRVDSVQPVVHRSFDGRSRVRLLGRLAGLEFLALIRQPTFQFAVALLVILTVLLATVLDQNPDFPALPLTSRMTALRLPMGAFNCLFLLVITGELFFQERTVGLWSIFDALPQPATVRLTAKWLALCGVAALLTAMLLLTGIGIQLSHAFTDIDWRLYAIDLTIDGFLRYCQWITLGAFVAILVNSRFLSHLLSLLLFLLSWVTYQAGFADYSLYLFSFLPAVDYSDLTGYGAIGFIRLFRHGMWWGLTGILGTLTLLLWSRGVPTRLATRIRILRHQVRWPYGIALLLSAILFGLGLWRSAAVPVQTKADLIAPIHLQTTSFTSLSGRRIPIRISYVHPYQVRHILQAAQAALRRGEHLFGAYPHPYLQFVETPPFTNASRSLPGKVLLSERMGWTADHRQPDQLDYIDYLISREVFKQWLTQRMHPVRRPGDGFLRQSLAEYLALRAIGEQYGPDRLKQRLAQRTALYLTNRTDMPEKSLLQSSGNDALERGRAALVLAGIGQIWGDSSLSQCMVQFYRQAVQKPASATATAFATHLHRQLPDSLRYLTTYLDTPFWFDFNIGRIDNLPNGLSIEIVPKKWRQTQLRYQQPIPINDYVPVAIFDAAGRVLYQTTVHPNPDERFVQLPAIPAAASVVVDPLGAWPERNKQDNRKIF